MPSRIPPEERDAIAEAIRSGQPRNEIAREFKRSAGSISNIADEYGLTDAFDRSATKNATEAAAADNAARRAALSAKFLKKADQLLDQIDDPHTVFNFGGKDNTFEQRTLPKPPTGDIRNLMIAAATAFDKHMAAEKHDSGAGAEQLGSLLGGMFSEMVARHADPEA